MTTDATVIANTNANAYQTFFSTPVEQLLSDHLAKDCETHVLNLFHDAAARVPAYADFLDKHGVTPASINDIDAFRRLPQQEKGSYMRAYPLAQRCYDGRLDSNEMLAVSSGSTGEPLFWPRSVRHEIDICYRFEHVLKHNFDCHQRSTLAIVCFALGTWIGGMFTASSCRLLAQKGLPLTLATPGNNIPEILRVLNRLADSFEQVVLFGYPPFLKTLLDAGRSEGVAWSNLNVRMVFAGEVFSEEWRTLVTERLGQTDPVLTTASLYGTADGGVLGNETPLSIAIRRYLSDHPDLARDIFGESRLPTLVQYDPISRFFEVVDNTLVVSGDNGVPLIRYHIADRGGIISFDDMMSLLREHGWDPERVNLF